MPALPGYDCRPIPGCHILFQHLDDGEPRTLTAPYLGVLCEPVENPWFHRVGNSRPVVTDISSTPLPGIPGGDFDNYIRSAKKYETVRKRLSKTTPSISLVSILQYHPSAVVERLFSPYDVKFS